MPTETPTASGTGIYIKITANILVGSLTYILYLHTFYVQVLVLVIGRKLEVRVSAHLGRHMNGRKVPMATRTAMRLRSCAQMTMPH